MRNTVKRLLVTLTAAIITFTGFTQSVQAAMVGTDQAHAAVATQQQRDRILNEFDRPEVQSRLEQLGVDMDAARARVAAMSDDEVVTMASEMDSLPAGGDSFLGAIVFIFVLLLVTDLLGLTKVFPFTRAQR